MSNIKIIFQIIILFTIVCGGFFHAEGQEKRMHNESYSPKEQYTIHWYGIEKTQISETEYLERLAFKDAVYPYTDNTPAWHLLVSSGDMGYTYRAEIRAITTSALTKEEASLIRNSENVGREFRIELERAIIRKEPYHSITVIPIRRLPGGEYERLETFSVHILSTGERVPLPPPGKGKGNPVLSSGTWYKLEVGKSGVYRIDYAQLSSMGFTGQGSDKVQLFGMGGEMLPESAGTPGYEGLQETAIEVVDGGDGSIDQGDYILFYGEGAGQWLYDSLEEQFIHEQHLYDDYNYYYITKGSNPGLRVEFQIAPGGPPTHSVTTFHDYSIDDNDSLNLIKSGKLWVGRVFDLKTTYQFNFPFPNIDPGTPAKISVSLVARSLASSAFTITSGNLSFNAPVIQISSGYQNQYAFEAIRHFSINPSGNNIPLTISYNKPLSSSIGWLNYILINLRRQLIFTGNQFSFRAPFITGSGNIAQFQIEQATSGLQIWDITNPLIPQKISGNLNGTQYSFIAEASDLKEYIAFGGTGFQTADIKGKVSNQNLADSKFADMVIVSHPDFLTAANRLATLHKEKTGISCLVVTPEQIYNEFSSGKQDPAAIRNFIKMLYDRATLPEEMPRYLLLFGDGSYDNKDRLTENTHFIPTFQSVESFHPAYTYVTDDFYGLLDDNEGINGYGHLDIGIGRMVVGTLAEAMQMVDKIERYMSINKDVEAGTICTGGSTSKPQGEWRNVITLIADDEDTNLHIDQAETLANNIDQQYRVYNISKIFLDAYQQVSISGGHRYPDVNLAINKQMEKGALVMNYIGHGGELGWAHERILRNDDIFSWTNRYQMPLFVTSTCEFTRFDDPERRSAGEYVFLQPNGGGIAMYTTTRLAFASSNYAFNTAFYQHLFKKDNQDEHLRIGDIFRMAKTTSGSQSSNRNIVILGDPALMLAYPRQQVVTTHINDTLVTPGGDTLRALSKVTISGIIVDQNNQHLTQFNGTLYPTVYDKKGTFTTRANDQGSYPKSFWMQKNALYKGKVTIKNGEFSFSFIVPKDISYGFGFGKISYYGEDGTTDAHGYYDGFIVGGTSDNPLVDNQGPTIRLFMNDTSFVSGGTTDKGPVLLAYLKDENGINTTGGGIGHDIVGVLDENTNTSIVLNDYYESDLDSYNSGVVTYGLTDLEDGPHTITLKAWDIFNNSSEATLDFLVASADDPILTHVFNYPNPFTTYTEFWFEHNQPCCELEAMIEIFTISGRIVKTIRKIIPTTGYRAEPIPWDGLDEFGDRLAKGVYVYKVTIRNQQQQQAEKFEKLVLLR